MYLENYWGYGDNRQRNRREILSIIRKKICYGSEITFWSRTNGSKLPSMSEMIWNFESMFLLNYFTDCNRLWLIGKGIWCVLRKNNPVKKTSIKMYFGHVSRGKMYSHNIYHQTLIMATRTTPLSNSSSKFRWSLRIIFDMFSSRMFWSFVLKHFNPF